MSESEKLSKAIQCLTHCWWVEHDVPKEYRCEGVVKDIENTLLDLIGFLPGKSIQ